MWQLYFYYVRNNFYQTTIATGTRAQLFGVYRTNLKGEGSADVVSDKIGYCLITWQLLILSTLYTDEEGMTFYKIKIDGNRRNKNFR